MKRFSAALASLLLLTSCSTPTPLAAANSTVSAMTAATALGGAELLYCVQTAADKKCTTTQVAAYVYSLMSGDATATGLGVLTLATVNANVGSFGSAVNCPSFTVNAKGLITAASATACTPAVGGITGLGTGVATAAGLALSTAGGLTSTIAAGTAALATASIASATCAAAVTVVATNTATTDVVTASFNADPTAVTGYIPLTTGMLTIVGYPTAGNVNFKVCNNTGSSITPGAITLNWRVTR